MPVSADGQLMSAVVKKGPGRDNCPQLRSIGSYENGGFARRFVVPVRNLHPLPESLGDIDGVLSEPLACVTQCLFGLPVISPGDRVLVTGPVPWGRSPPRWRSPRAPP